MFGSIAFIAGAQLRRRIGGLLVIAVVAALVGGVSLALIAGSRRSATVVDRFFARSRPYSLTIGGPAYTRDQLLAMPHVVRADPNTYLGMVPIDANGVTSKTTGINGLGMDMTALDDTIVYTEGEPPAPGDTFGVAVNEAFVKQFGKRVGDKVPVQFFDDTDDVEDIARGVYRPSGPKFTFHITGVARSPEDVATNELHPLAATTGYSTTNAMFVPIEFWEQHHKSILQFGESFFIQLDDPRNEKTFLEDLAKVKAPPGPQGSALRTDPPPFTEKRGSFKTPVELETNALLAIGVALALAGAVVLAFMLRADHRSVSRDDPTLRALGATRLELGYAALLRTAPVALVGAVGSLITAVALSNRFPIGVGRLLELDPGTRVNVTVLGIGTLALAALLLVCAFTFGYAGQRSDRHVRHRGRVAGWIANTGAPNELVLASHLAFGRSAETGARPTRAALVGGALALVVVVAAGMFVNGVDDLYSDPAAHGFAWDMAIGNVNFALREPQLSELRNDPDLPAKTFIEYGQAQIGGRSVEVMAFDERGTASPPVLAGRLPSTRSEIALGPRLREQLHVKIGDTVPFSVAGGEFQNEAAPAPTKQLTVVGEALTPVFGESELSTTALVTLDAISSAGGTVAPNIVLVRLPDKDKEARVSLIRRAYTAEMETDPVPARIVNLHRVVSLPLLGIALAGLLGTVLLAYTLYVTARSRTRELGIVRALGMSARNSGRVLIWQGVLLAVVISAIGIPLGLAVGTFAWRAMAESLGVATDAIYKLWIPGLVLAVAIVGIACSWLPARRARKTNVATLLRVE
jgi:ABC-type lipoprotein release transport system permease subunit